MSIRVVMADDSATFRQFVRGILAEDDELELVGEATTGREAIELVGRLEPDIALMDIHMPELDGLEATKEIMMRAPTPIIIVSSSIDRHGVGMSLNATQAGALMALPKPDQLANGGYDEFSRELRAMLKAMAHVKVVRRWAPSLRADRPRIQRPANAPRNVRLVTIAASTGGPAAIRRVLMDLPRDFPVPILIVQHIAFGFAHGFAEWLAGGTPLRVKVAEDGEALDGGIVYVAPDGVHLGVSRARSIALSRDAAIGGFRPSATHLFRSAAAAVGSEHVAIILTGMGSDGVDGLAATRQAGGYVIAQDERSSIVFGMAQEALRNGVVDLTLPIDDIARQLVEIVCMRNHEYH
jgi:two-component system, chemotaxis family, protein-glutamate methylesterase/glutaminase